MPGDRLFLLLTLDHLAALRIELQRHLDGDGLSVQRTTSATLLGVHQPSGQLQGDGTWLIPTT